MNTAFAIVDESGTIQTAKLAAIAAALTIQLNRDFAPVWGGAYQVRLSNGADLVKGECVVSIVASFPSDGATSQAIAYHDVDGNGVPFIMVSLLMVGSSPLSVSISHELLEEALDPGCNVWSDNMDGKEFAYEACDATESDIYTIDGVEVSNFLYPDFFRVGAIGPYSHIGATGAHDPVPGPFQTARGGYQDVRTTSGATVSQVMGRDKQSGKDLVRTFPSSLVQDREYAPGYDANRRALKEEKRKHRYSRAARRANAPNVAVFRHEI